MIQNTSARLTIFEGPDGSGKSTAARAYAQATGAKYVHMPAMPRVAKGLARIYVEAMMPAILGYQDVVMDRCWLSEAPYGVAFREGQDRLTSASRRMLERLAFRCGAVVVMCRPDYEVVRANYLSRRHLEMLNNEAQLRMVYDAYLREPSALPRFIYNYTKERPITDDYVSCAISDMRPTRHPLELGSAGNWHAKTVVVGESFAERKDCDPWYQWPFASFSNSGCSQWLTDEFDRIGISEAELLWLNADQDLEVLYDLEPTTVIALGDTAYKQLYELKIFANKLVHPQAWKRFKSSEPYPLLKLFTTVVP